MFSDADLGVADRVPAEQKHFSSGGTGIGAGKPDAHEGLQAWTAAKSWLYFLSKSVRRTLISDVEDEEEAVVTWLLVNHGMPKNCPVGPVPNVLNVRKTAPNAMIMAPTTSNCERVFGSISMSFEAISRQRFI